MSLSSSSSFSGFSYLGVAEVSCGTGLESMPYSGFLFRSSSSSSVSLSSSDSISLGSIISWSLDLYLPLSSSLKTLSVRAYQVLLFFKFQYWGVFFWCIFMCRTNVRKYIFFKNAFFLCKFDNQFYKGIGSKIQREMCRFGFLHFMLQNC